MDAKHWTGAPGERWTDPECQPRHEHDDRPVAVCDYAPCGRTLGIGAVTVAGKGQWCCSQCRDASAGQELYQRIVSKRTA